MATITTSSGMTASDNKNLAGYAPSHYPGGAQSTNPAVGAFVPRATQGGNMNSDLNQAVTGSWSSLSPTVSDPSKWANL
jgi:hypothetical protein